MKVTTPTIVILLVCAFIVLIVYFKPLSNTKEIEKKKKTAKKKTTQKINKISNKTIHEVNPINPIFTDISYVPVLVPVTVPVTAGCGQSIKQFRLDINDIKNLTDTDYENLSYKYGFKYPIRIRSARDMIHPDTTGYINPDEEIIDIKQLIDMFQNICNVAKYHGNNKIWEKIVIQEIPPPDCKEYIISCLNGVVDKLYTINDKVVKEISMKNISNENKKYLRNILFFQHKKLKTVKGLFELAFITNKPLTESLAGNSSFKYIGITIYLNIPEDERDIRDTKKIDPSKQISYPYTGENMIS
jgi:hypothetical protein